MKPSVTRLVALVSLLTLIFPSFVSGLVGPAPLLAQGDSRLFPETGKTLKGTFLNYWNEHGTLTQQGFPISEEMQEKSDTDGKTYTVQYFERGVFEAHPENQAPYDVLLSLLGVFLYKQKYPGTTGAPAQMPNNVAGSLLFPETGKRVGGKFLDYWQKNGGLSQQGLPISDEFSEVSTLNGQTYRVQYFERAVFELHPENAGSQYEVLLSQLGTFQYKRKYLQPTPAPTALPPTPLPQPTSTPGNTADCSGIPPSENMVLRPACGPAGANFYFDGSGFQPGENVGLYTTLPSGEVFGPRSTAEADATGKVKGVYVSTDHTAPNGIWATTMEGLSTHKKAIGYFKVTAPVPPDCSGIPTNINMLVTPNCAVAGTRFEFTATGFMPGEQVGRFYTSSTGEGINGNRFFVTRADNTGTVREVIFNSFVDDDRGIWAATFEGVETRRKAIGYFKILNP